MRVTKATRLFKKQNLPRNLSLFTSKVKIWRKHENKIKQFLSRYLSIAFTDMRVHTYLRSYVFRENQEPTGNIGFPYVFKFTSMAYILLSYIYAIPCNGVYSIL